LSANSRPEAGRAEPVAPTERAAAVLAATSDQTDGGIAAVSDGRPWSYDELGARVEARARLLRSQGLGPGEVVVAAERPSLDLLIMQHALARLECGLLPVSNSGDDPFRNDLVRTSGAEWRWYPEAGTLVPTGTDRRPPTVSGLRLALVVETSGSSAAPKAVMLSYENVLASARLVNRRLGLRRGDCWLSCLPRTHVGGLMIGYRCGLACATVLLHEGFDAPTVARDLELHRVTHVSLVPPMLDRLLAEVQVPPKWLRVLLIGGQSLSRALARRAIDAGWPLRVTYGMTETASQVATSDVLVTPPETGFVGSALPGIRVSCRGTPESPERIKVRGPVVMAGYANPERSPGKGLEKGWLVTSDIGYISDGGDLVVLGRADQLLVIGGEGVIPSQVEDRMMSATGLERVAVVGVGDPVWGHRMIAVYTGGIGEDALEQWCRVHLAPRERPRGYRRLTGLPLLVSGKPDRRRILEIVAASCGADGKVAGMGGNPWSGAEKDP